MQKKFYIVCVFAVIVLAIATTIMMRQFTNKSTPTQDTGSVTTSKVIVEDGELIEVEREVSEVKDLDTLTQEFADSIQYSDINITVTESGFQVSDAFKWGGDDFWYDEDPNGFARYSAYYELEYGDYAFKAKASDSLNEWIGENTSITYALAAAVGETETDDMVAWYVIFREYPDDLVRATYYKESGEFSYEKLF